ncbi:exoribonuclease R [Erysipelotrichaceae bacterium]|nr:exoribonuclease R [Erysipelotrichaceae bacterium]
MKIKDSILEHFQEQNQKYQIDRINLAKSLNIAENEYQLLFKALNILEKEQLLRRHKNGMYQAFDGEQFAVGVIRTHRKGFGFVTIEGEADDLFVGVDLVNGAMDGDTVLVKKIVDQQNPGKFAAMVVEIKEHANKTLVGEVAAFNTKYLRILLDNSNYLGDVFVKKIGNEHLIQGQKVVVLPKDFLVTGKIIADVIEIIGHRDDPGVDIVSIVKKFDIPLEFPVEIQKILHEIPLEVEQTACEGRTDLQQRQIVTIDGADAKDLDDAISLIELENGNFMLGVHIADVSNYVKPESPIDREALSRGTSIYLADRVIPMLPQQLSNGVCSLNPDVVRLCVSCDMEIDATGKVVQSTIYRSYIKSAARMTYKDVNAIIEKTDEDLLVTYQNFLELFTNMEQLAKILASKRHTRGSLDFDLNEAKIVVDDMGRAIDVSIRERGVSEHIIEQFMIEANEAIATVFADNAWPFIYRIHAKPKENKIELFCEVAKHLGIPTKKLREATDLQPKILQDILTDISGMPEHSLLSTLLLRTMQKAEYATTNIGHFGLAAKNYTHFTSPIRRYPDLMVHRLIIDFIIEKTITEAEFARMLVTLADIAKMTSKSERTAIECEREVNSMKMAEYMEQHMGETFKGIISGVSNSGIFVELPNMVEGHVPMETLTDDFYQYHEGQLLLRGRRTSREFIMGNAIEVELTYANKKAAIIRFKVVGMKIDSFNERRTQGNFQKGGNANRQGGNRRDGNRPSGTRSTGQPQNDGNRRDGNRPNGTRSTGQPKNDGNRKWESSKWNTQYWATPKRWKSPRWESSKWNTQYWATPKRWKSPIWRTSKWNTQYWATPK